MKVHEALARSLAEHGVDTVFGVAGDGNLFFIDSFVRECGGRYVAAANEAGAMMMASGYGAASGRLGVVTVTHGPGLTNTVTGLVETAKGSQPILLVVGDTPATDRDSPQVIAQREIIIAAGAGFELVRAPQTILEDAALAIRRAFAERRPIALNVPSEFMWTDVEYARSVRPDLALLSA
jgi:thiamine pyrophosphate-dependent acetolactate synthase large subunit-like protein